MAIKSVTIDESGTQASVVNEGTPDDAELAFTIPRGPAGTVAVGSVTTGAAGTNAAVTNAGTASEAVLNFTIPRGNKGDTGAQGPKGDTGGTPTLPNFQFEIKADGHLWLSY
jgi:hypothetical protein